MTSVTQYGSIFSAIGCGLDFVSRRAQLEVISTPDFAKDFVQNALDDISKFEDTSNFFDGMAAIHLADTLDGEANPISASIKANVLTALGILKDGRFVAQNLAQQKTNRSWHTSTKPSECSYFGEICTHRGIQQIPGKRGRKSTRNPDQYHRLSSSGEIAREQLVTPALESLVTNIPAEKLVSINSTTFTPAALDFEHMQEDQIAEILERIKRVQADREKIPV